MPQPSRPLPTLALTCGDPAGIGPEVVLAAWQATAAHERARLRERLHALGPERLGDVVMDLDGPALARWLTDDHAT